MPQQPLTITKAEPLTITKSEPVTSPTPAAGRGTGYDPNDQGFLTKYLSEALASVNPSTVNAGVQSAFWHPIETVKSIGRAQGELEQKAEDAFKRGDYLTGVRHTINYLLPLIGPRMDQAGDFAQQGEIAKSLGATTDVALQTMGPALVKNVTAALPRRVGGAFANPNPVAAEAVAYGQRSGIPVDAATASGSDLIQSMQKKASDTPAGAILAERFKRRQVEALKNTAQDLANRAHPTPVTREQAGQLAQDAVRGNVQARHGEASAAYGELRDIANQNVENVGVRHPQLAPDDAPVSFTYKPNALPDEVFEHVYEDAKQNGYTGAKGDLRRKFDEQLKKGYDGLEASDEGAAELSPETLLKDIRKYGGLKPFDVESGTKYRGEYESIQQGFNSHTSGWHQRGAAQIFRNNGLSLDGMLEALRQDPKWSGKFESTNDLLNELNDIARGGPTAKMARATAQDALRLTDVKPWSQWWVPYQSADVALPVDLAGARPALAPLYDRLARKKELTGSLQGAEARAQVALDSLMRGPDAAGLETVDAALSDLKALARGNGDTLPELRSSGQGVAAQAVQVLDKAVREAAERGGPDAVAALERGRKATIAKYAAADVLKGLEGQKAEPVGTVRRLTAPGDSAFNQLRDLAREAPDVLPQIGRSVLDGMFGRATGKGSFQHAAALQAQWEKLGPQTKAMLFKEPGYVGDLDNFFRLAQKIAENPNGSGTARIANLYDLGSNAIGYPVAKIMYSKAGVRLLTQGLTLPIQSPTAVTAWVERVRRLAATLPRAGAIPADVTAANREGTPR